MSDDPTDKLFIRTIALEEILQHLIVKIAQASSGASRQWIADLEKEIENSRELVLAAGDANTKHTALAGHVAMEVKRILKPFVE
ncbi:MAG: hypothetical protein ABSG18_26145 [Steroidobacteraceae bacterium]